MQPVLSLRNTGYMLREIIPHFVPQRRLHLVADGRETSNVN